MILNFKSQFVPKIFDGSKIHTIRKGNRWKAEMGIHFTTGARTKNYKCFEVGFCTGVQKILIYRYADNRISIKIDGKPLQAFNLLSKNDGFKNVKDFIEWFLPAEKCTGHLNIWEGQIIHWTNFKY